MEPQTWQAFFLKLSSFIEDYERNQGRETDVDRITSVRDSAKHFLSTLTEISELLFVSLPGCELEEDEVGVVKDIMSSLEALKVALRNIISQGHEAEQSILRSSGCTFKTLQFSVEQMCFLRSIGLSWTRISAIFGVSRMTLYLKRKEAGILDDFKYSPISDEELERKVQDIKVQMPDIGEKMISGVLRSNGICVQRHRIRKAIHSIDPIKTALRWHEKVQRRSYSVPGPMSLWHIGEFCIDCVYLCIF